MCDCAKPLILNISGKTSDMCCYKIPALGIDKDGYVPYGLGVGGGDYLTVSVCLACGKLQKFTPMTEDEVREALSE